MANLAIRALCTAAVALAAATPLFGQTAGCRFAAPTELDARPSAWLGECRNGAADGLGVIRAGTREPYSFFAGRMAHGRPANGLLLLQTGMMAAIRFDASGRVVSSDGLHPQQDEHIFAQAQNAARAVSARFAKAGNPRSATYYKQLARRILVSQPE